MKLWTLLLAGASSALACNAVDNPGHRSSTPGAASTVTSPAPQTEVARVHGEPITVGDIDARLGRPLYEMRLGMLKSMVFERLTQAEAAQRGVSVDELLRAEIEAKVPSISEAAVAAEYERRVAAGLVPAGNFENVVGELGQRMTESGLFRRRDQYAAELMDRANVDLNRQVLGEPRVKILGTGPSIGKQDAKVTVFEFADLLSPFGAMSHRTVERLRAEHGAEIRFVFRQKPESPEAKRVAAAALCAHQQGKYWEFRQRIIVDQARAMEPAALGGYASALGLDTGAFDQCLQENRTKQWIESDLKEAAELELEGNPVFVANGVVLSGAHAPDAFERFFREGSG